LGQDHATAVILLAIEAHRPHVPWMSNRTEPRDAQQDHSDAIARWNNEGGAPANHEQNSATWFVPPIVIPAALVLLIVARVVALAYFGTPFS
jgi:hypothetical protein